MPLVRTLRIAARVKSASWIKPPGPATYKLFPVTISFPSGFLQLLYETLQIPTYAYYFQISQALVFSTSRTTSTFRFGHCLNRLQVVESVYQLTLPSRSKILPTWFFPRLGATLGIDPPKRPGFPRTAAVAAHVQLQRPEYHATTTTTFTPSSSF